MSRVKVMIVDDNPANLKLASDLLELEGYEICRCKDAEEALEKVFEFHPDLILMDIGLPGMDGMQLTRKLKLDDRTSDITIVALTAYAMKGDKDRILVAGFDGYITKPIDTRLFRDQILNYLK